LFYSRYASMAAKSSISFVTILLPLLVLRNSKLPVTNPLNYFCNSIRLFVEFGTTGEGLPDLLNDFCYGSPSGFWAETSTTGRSISISIALRGPKKFLVGSSPWNRILVSLSAGAVVAFSLIFGSSHLMESACVSFADGNSHYRGQGPPPWYLEESASFPYA
jgi:hypothetical protein